MIRANDFYAENITFQNTAGNIMKIAISKARSILFFKRAEIKSLRNGYITASSTTESQKYGYVLIDSTLKKGTAAAQSVYLGRPWRPHSAVTFLYTKMDDHIKAEGWHNWDNRHNERTARYKEFRSTGAGSDVANRVKWSSILTKNEASQITVQAVLGGADGWNPEKR